MQCGTASMIKLICACAHPGQSCKAIVHPLHTGIKHSIDHSVIIYLLVILEEDGMRCLVPLRHSMVEF